MSDIEYEKCLYNSYDNSEYENDTDNEEIIEEESCHCDINSYPLKSTWVLYDHTKSDSETYDANIRKICEFDTVIKFWQTFNNYPVPSKLFNNNFYKPVMNGKEISSLSVFKKGIFPKWEDSANILGAEVSKRKFNKKNPLNELDNNWFELLIECVSANIDNCVTGIRVVDSSSVKKNETTNTNEFKLLYRIELWFSDCSRKNIIETQFKTILNIDDPRYIIYKEHNIQPIQNEQ